MRLKSILAVLIILGFLAGCTFPGVLPPFLSLPGAATPLPANTTSRLLAAGARVWHTDQGGTLIILSDGTTYTIQQSDAWKVFLPLVMKSIPPPSTQTPTPTATSTPTPTRTFTPVSTGCTLTHNGDFEQQLYVLINNERANVGLAPLTANGALEISAGLHSDDMAVNHFMSHTGSDGSTFWERAVRAGYTGHHGGEIIVGGSSPQAAVDWWMSDAPHRDMILSDTHDFGAGYAHCSRNYFTVDFGHR